MPKRSSWLVISLLLTGCEERDRPTFPLEPGAGVGPVTRIEDPSVDTMLTAGVTYLVGGRTIDSDGVDSLYYEITGSGQGFLPASGHGEAEVIFGLPIQTVGLASGTVVTIRVRAKDILGHDGEAATRQLTIE
jgi:hypothetical protein